MKHFPLYIIVTSLVLTGIFSCRPKEVASTDNNIQFDTIYSVKNFHLENDSTKPSCNLKVSFIYPSEYKDEATLKSLQDIFISCFFDESYVGLTPQKAVESYEEKYIENYKEDALIFSKEQYEHDPSQVYSSYYEIDNNTIMFNQDGILSFQINQTNYKGGAASYNLLKNFSIDINNGRLITEDDIFNDNQDKALNIFFRDYLLKKNNVKTIFDLENLGYFGIEEMIPNGNFFLDNNGITYIFNLGEISSYSKEPVTIFIPYKDIKPLIKEESIISKFISL